MEGGEGERTLPRNEEIERGVGKREGREEEKGVKNEERDKRNKN